LNAQTPVPLRLLAGVSSIALPALAVLTAAAPAHAGARLSGSLPDAHLSSPAPPAPPFTIAPRLGPAWRFVRPFHAFADLYRGIASWYGRQFNGRLTASGQPFNMYAMTAATPETHHSLPLGSTVRVTDRHSGRSVVVRINDRGPLPHGRIIDLSYGAASRLAMIQPGLADVRLHVLSWGKDRER